MRILIGWDNPVELETILAFLNIGENCAEALPDADSLARAIKNGPCDALLLALNFPSPTDCFCLFKQIRELQPDLPIVGAWFQGELGHIAKFLLGGLHSYVLRDDAGEFIMLLATVLEAAHAAVQARRVELLAEKLREEVESVRQLQESVIPRNLPEAPGYRMVARYEPSEIRILGDRPVVMAGGDYYDVFRMRDEEVVLLLGDAAGHGVKACLSIMTMHTLISMIRDHTQPTTAQFVSEVNRRLCQSSIVAGEQGGFITLLYGSLDIERHVLRWTSAGHPLPLLHDLTTNEVRPMGQASDGGLPLAVMEDWEYTLVETPLPPRCRVLLYTDGLDEAFPAGGDKHSQFGIHGISETLKATAHLPLEEAMLELFAASNRCTQGAGRMDDTSIVLIERQ
jgi:serine phosphatase RsbU (regulator of sigma subunit)